MENKILLSFIIPMYNAEQYIGTCIESIIAQNLEKENYEIVVIDDGSIDKGESIVKKYDCVSYYRQTNQGQSAARNKGIELSKGKYICFVDADDILIPNSIEFCLQTALREDLEMVTYDLVRCNEDSTNKIDAIVTNKIDTILTGYEYMEKYNFNNGPWWYLINKTSLRGIQFVEGHFGEDGMFTIELLMHIKRVAHINNQCYCYVKRDNSTTTKKDKAHLRKMIDDYLFVYHYIQKLIKQNESSLSSKTITRLTNRSESYIFFLLVRLLRSPEPSLISPTVKKLKEEGLYPIKQPYPGTLYTLTTFVVNHYGLFRTFNWFINIINFN